MAASTPFQIAQNMVQQLRLLDPNISAEVGTPERKIIDTVAQALSASQIDLGVIDGNLDLDSKFGTNLDVFLGLFGFARQIAVSATGLALFSRPQATTTALIIPVGAQITNNFDPTTSSTNLTRVVFEATAAAFIPAGQTQVYVPIRATSPGTIGNMPANSLTTFVGSPVFGVSAVTNPVPTTGGTDAEDDNAFKDRFKNTVFKNLAGTEDQFLGLAVSGVSTKAKVVGPVSRYREYFQVPEVDDASVDANSSAPLKLAGNGVAGHYTTALSSIPSSKHFYDTLPSFVTSGNTSQTSYFYTPQIDFLVNNDPVTKYQGDTYRQANQSPAEGLNPISDTARRTDFQPNVTFINVYTGTDDTVTAVRPNDLVVFEHSYMSTASRNDYDRGITNSVDVYVDGANSVAGNVITSATTKTFSANPDTYYVENFRRLYQPDFRPAMGNYFIPVLWTPLTDVPLSVTIGLYTYYKGVHYWALQDNTALKGTIRALDGIEFSSANPGAAANDTPPTYDDNGNLSDVGGPFSGPSLSNNLSAHNIISFEIDNYLFDQNIIDTQNAIENAKQVTTDVLVHQAVERFFKLDLTVVYDQGANTATTNDNIELAVNDLFQTKYFGASIQLSDILQTVHNVPGVDNVRWSYDSNSIHPKVVECDRFGNPRYGPVFYRYALGDPNDLGGIYDTYDLYFIGNLSGNFALQTAYQTYTSTAIVYTTDASVLRGKIQNAFNASPVNGWTTSTTTWGNITLFRTVLNNPVPVPTLFPPFPKIDYQITTTPVNANPLLPITSVPSIPTAPFFNQDFFLGDNELPNLCVTALSTDTLPGLIIRQRAQNTYLQ